MTDYSKACVYKLVCKDESITDMYIGSTKKFNHRRNCHKSVCNNIKRPEYNYKVYKFIRDNGDWENWEMVKEYCKKYRSENKDKLKKTKAIYTLNHKEEKKIYDKKYREKNKDKIKAYLKAYRAKKKATQSSLLG